MDITNAINEFYFNMNINELRLSNSKFSYGSLSYNSFLYLTIISLKENCTVSYIADALNISKSAVTIKVNELIKKGFLTKTQSNEDKRINYLSLSENVSNEYKMYDEMLLKGIKKAENKFSKQEIDTFCNVIKFISKACWEVDKDE